MKYSKLYTENPQIILASRSKTRRRILKKYNIRARYVEHKVDEDTEIANNKHLKKKMAVFLAKKKIKSIEKEYKGKLIIGSDQIILCKNLLINKPRHEKEAVKNLMILQNNCHTLISAICVLTPDERLLSFEDTAQVFMSKINEYEIRTYVKNNKNIVYETSGSYKIEKDKLNCIQKIKGDTETVQGFPIKKILPILKMYYK